MADDPKTLAESPGPLSGPVGDRCPNCNAPFAADQRYCINCGERRGRPRFSFSELSAQAAASKAQPPAKEPRRQSSGSSPLTFIAGVAVLLLAMGVGVGIGVASSGTTTTVASAPSQKPIIINAGGVSGGSSSNAGSKRSKSGSTGAVSSHAHISRKVQAAASQAASKVLGAAAPKNPTATIGTKGSGPGYCNGRFTGQFFGSC